MPVIHIVLFEFKPSVTYAQVKDACEHMLSLKDKCIHPHTREPYMKSYGGGRDTSPEGLQGAFSHGFVCEFASEEDRAYYLDHDPAHVHFKDTVKNLLQNVRVVDYESGKF